MSQTAATSALPEVTKFPVSYWPRSPAPISPTWTRSLAPIMREYEIAVAAVAPRRNARRGTPVSDIARLYPGSRGAAAVRGQLFGRGHAQVYQQHRHRGELSEYVEHGIRGGEHDARLDNP